MSFSDGTFEYSIINEETVSIISYVGIESPSIFIPSTTEYFGIKYKVISLGDSVFQNNQNSKYITTVTFDDDSQIISIGQNCFLGCKALTSIIIPNTVTSIGADCFLGCKALSSITFDSPSQLTNIGDYCFSETSINSIIIPNTVTTIGQDCFNSCTYLTSVGLSTALTNIPIECFYGTNITSITIPTSVTSIGSYNTQTYSGSGNILYILNESYCFNKLSYINIPSSINNVDVPNQTGYSTTDPPECSIGMFAFYNSSEDTLNVTVEDANATSVYYTAQTYYAEALFSFTQTLNSTITFYNISDYKDLNQSWQANAYLFGTVSCTGGVSVTASNANTEQYCYEYGTNVYSFNADSEEKYVSIKNLAVNDSISSLGIRKKIILKGKIKYFKLKGNHTYLMRRTDSDGLLEYYLIKEQTYIFLDDDSLLKDLEYEEKPSYSYSYFTLEK